jgi:TorA maturation chaperone TorD
MRKEIKAGAELEFMYFLIFKEFEAFSNLDKQTATDYIQKQKSFLEDHLMAWVPLFVANIIEHAETLFYQYLAKLERLDQAILDVINSPEKTQKTTSIGTLF